MRESPSSVSSEFKRDPGFVLRKILASWSRRSTNGDPAPERVPMVTIASGFPLIPTCTTRPFERALYYPIGLVVEALGPRRTITVAGEQRPYALVQAEYGLRFFLPEKDLRPVDPGEVYFFVDGPGQFPYCVGSATCDTEESQARGRVLHPQQRYGMATGDTRGIPSSRCGVYEITPFSAGHAPTLERAYLDTCIADPTSPDGERVRNGSIRVVTRDTAEQRMTTTVGGTYQRINTSLVQKIVPGVVPFKECGVEIEEETTLTLGGALKLPLSALEGGIGAGNVKTVTHELGKEHYYLFSAYSYQPLDSPGADFAYDDITFVAECDRLKPKKAAQIHVHNESFTTNAVIVDAHDLVTDQYRIAFKDQGFSETKADELRSGRFWTIKGSDQYFYWRAALRQHLLENSQLEPLLLQETPERQEAIVDFFAHIILASAFAFK
jgi:hypothetical protein